jgi:hypothetical protein
VGTGRWAVARAAIFFALSFLVILLSLGLTLRWPIGSDDESLAVDTPPPAEFLYLDSQRALAYLAQMQGGTTTSEEQSHKVTRSVTSQLALQGLLHAGATSEAEEAAQRVVTPTAASSYIELINTLEADGDLVDVENIGNFQDFTETVKEGQFVHFTAESMRPPTYVSPYLAVRQKEALNALFPVVGSSSERDQVLTVRRAARKFVERVGDNPRIVFDLRPNGGGAAAVQYLLPIQYAGLSHERSLIKNGGGEFQVLGKVVRVFPESEEEKDALDRHRPPKGIAYLDSAARDTWSEPLKHADPELICRAAPQCAQEVAENSEERGGAFDEAMHALSTGLSTQTQIRSRGAVIIPVAIYK